LENNVVAQELETEIAEESRIVVDCLMQKKPIPDEIRTRIVERSRLAREALLRTHGVQEIAVDLIREVREGTPDS